MQERIVKGRLIESARPTQNSDHSTRYLESNGSAHEPDERQFGAGHLFAEQAESYLVGLDGKRGAALLAASVRDVLVRIDTVCAITGLSVPTIYRLMAKGAFPRPVKITTSARAWKLSEISAWVEGCERGGAL